MVDYSIGSVTNFFIFAGIVANAKATHIFFSKNISIYAIFKYQSFNDTLINDIISFRTTGPWVIISTDNLILWRRKLV